MLAMISTWMTPLVLFSSRSTIRIKPPNPNKQIQLALWANNGTSIVSMLFFVMCSTRKIEVVP